MYVSETAGGHRRFSGLQRFGGSWKAYAEARVYPLAERGVRTLLWEPYGHPHAVTLGWRTFGPNMWRTQRAHGWGSLNTLDARGPWFAKEDRTEQLEELQQIGDSLWYKYRVPWSCKIGPYPLRSGIDPDVLVWTLQLLSEAQWQSVIVDRSSGATWIGGPEYNFLQSLALRRRVLVEAMPAVGTMEAFGAACLWRFAMGPLLTTPWKYRTAREIAESGREAILLLGGPDFERPTSAGEWAAMVAQWTSQGWTCACALRDEELTNGTLDAIVDAVGSV